MKHRLSMLTLLLVLAAWAAVAATPDLVDKVSSTPGIEVLPLDAAGPPGTGAVQVLKDRFPSGRDRVAVDVFRPASGGRHPCVILLHGTHGPGRAESFYTGMAEDLARHGYLSLFPRYYDRGRKGKGSRAQWTQSIGDAITFAASLEGADPERMALIGYSQGAFLALNDAPDDARIRAVVAFYGGLSPGFFPRAEREMPPTLLFHGTLDRTVPVRRSVETLRVLMDAGHPTDLVVYPGAVHGFNLNGLPGPNAFAAQDSWRRTLGFLDVHLRYPAWTPAPSFSPVAPEQTPADGAHGAAVSYLAAPPADSAETALINPSPEQLDEIVRHEPPPRLKHGASGRHSRAQAKKTQGR